MSRYPDSPRPQAPYSFRNHRPFIGGGPVWAPQTRRLTRFGLGESDLSYRGNTWAEMKPLYDFFDSVGGPAGRFVFVDFNGIDQGGIPWTLFVAQGDGVATAWDAPTFGIVASPAPIVYANGIAATTVWDSATPAGGQYGVKPGTGTDGLDKIHAGTAPAIGAIVTIFGTCRRAFRKAMFTNPKNPFSLDVPNVYGQPGVTIVEVRK